MIILFQLVISLIALMAIVNIWMRVKEQVLTPQAAFFWTFVWSGAMLIVFFPDSTFRFSRLFGIGRGADFVIYLAVALLFIVIFRLELKIERMNRDITKVVRTNAIEKKQKK
jgi:hypothetical protein